MDTSATEVDGPWGVPLQVRVFPYRETVSDRLRAFGTPSCLPGTEELLMPRARVVEVRPAGCFGWEQ